VVLHGAGDGCSDKCEIEPGFRCAGGGRFSADTCRLRAPQILTLNRTGCVPGGSLGWGQACLFVCAGTEREGNTIKGFNNFHLENEKSGTYSGLGLVIPCKVAGHRLQNVLVATRIHPGLLYAVLDSRLDAFRVSVSIISLVTSLHSRRVRSTTLLRSLQLLPMEEKTAKKV